MTTKVTSSRNDLEDLSTVSENIDPGTNTSRVLRSAHKDHTKAINALTAEGPQNAVDAYWYNRSEGHIEQGRDLDFHIRVTPDKNIVEIWDNAGGMTKEKLANCYFKYSETGHEKAHSDTGGSQGKGAWVMMAWGEKAYVETHDKNGDRWWCTAAPRSSNGNRSEIKPVNGTGRQELDESGTYLRIHGLGEQAMEDLSDPELVTDKLTKKFPFALAHDNINFTVTIVGMGSYEPESYNFAQIFEEGGIVEGEDLNTFTKKGQQRQLKGLHLIDNREVSEIDDPPWKGVAMLKGGEYIEGDEDAGHPYLNVWPYKPQNCPVVQEGKLWGWIDASELCDDLEEHGHTGFVGSDIYSASGLRQRVLEVANEHFNNQTVADKGSSSRFVKNNLNDWLEKLDEVDKTKKDQKKGHPRDPVIHCSAESESKSVEDKVPLALTIETPRNCRVNDVHIHISVERIRDENGERIPQGNRNRTTTNITETVDSNYDNKELGAGMYKVTKEGKYKFKAELRQKPNVNEKMDNMGFDENNPAFRSKPVLSESYTTFVVGDIEIDTSESTPTQNTSASVVQEVIFTEKEGETWRAQIRDSEEEEGKFNLFVNSSHPEFKQLVKQHGVGKKGEVQGELGMRWGFLRVFMQRAGNEIEDELAKHNVESSEITATINGIIKKRLEEYDEFRYNFVPESPLFEE